MNSSPLPLSDVKILDLSRLLPGPFCSLILADFGADVLKLEDMGAGDYLRWDEPGYGGSERSTDSAAFLALNRNKRSIRVDLKSEQGREVFLRLIREYDVVLETFRPGTLDRLGVGYERAKSENPRLIWCALSGYGQTGPLVNEAGHDLNYLALGGVLGLGGTEDAPVQSATQIADLSGAMSAAIGILVALHERQRSGEGQFLDASLTDSPFGWQVLEVARYLATGRAPSRGETVLGGGVICYRPYRCSDGWVALAALEPKFWKQWCRGVEREDLIERQFDPAGSESHGHVERIFSARTRDEWTAFAREFECCLTPVLDLDEAVDSDLVRERSLVLEHDQPGIPVPVRTPVVTPKFSRTPTAHDRLPAPALGEHTEAILASIGYAEQEIEQLLAEGAVGGRLSTT